MGGAVPGTVIEAMVAAGTSSSRTQSGGAGRVSTSVGVLGLPMGSRFEGGTYRAVKHRVATREPLQLAHGRRVVATFFLRPAPEAVLAPPPSPKLTWSGRAPKPIKFAAWRQKVADKYERHNKQKAASEARSGREEVEPVT